MFIDLLQTYFKNERQGAVIGVIAGVCILIVCLVIRTRVPQSPMLKGFWYTLLFIGVFGVSGVFNIYNNTRRMEQFTAKYNRAPRVLVIEERARIAKIDTWWLPLRILWVALAAAGMAVLVFNRRNMLGGIATGLALIGSLGLIIDLFARQNSDAYKLELEKADTGVIDNF